MENPGTWGKVKRAIADALTEYNRQLMSGMCGLSEVSVIYNKLHEKGFVVEDTKEETDNANSEG